MLTTKCTKTRNTRNIFLYKRVLYKTFFVCFVFSCVSWWWAVTAAIVFAQQPTGDAQKGKELYLKYSCYACHGYDGHGGAAGFVAQSTTGTRPDQHDHDHQAVPSDLALRVKALESLLVEKGLVDRAALDAIVDAYETKIGPRNGARVVARAWVDPAYKKRLLTDD